MIRRILLFTLISAITQVANSQVRSFSQDSAVFIKEVTQFVKDAGVDAGNETAKLFLENWTKKGAFSAPMQKSIIKTSNELLRKNAKGYPDFNLYLSTLNEFYASGQINTKFGPWQQCVDAALKESKGRFTDFVKFSKDLFNSNSLYKSEIRQWYSSNKDYEFGLKNGEIAVLFKSLNLSCRTVGDQITIYETRGVLYPMKDRFDGTGGKVYWTRSGFDSTKVYAVIKKYSIDVSKSEYTSDSAYFYSADYFKAAVMGTLTDKAAPGRVAQEKYEYPYFLCYDKNLPIEKFSTKESRYKGSFAMKGSSVMAGGTDKDKAQFEFLYKGKVVVTIRAKEFAINDKSIITQKGELTINVDTMTIYHPQVMFNFNKEDKQIIITRGADGITAAPFFDSYHKLEIYVDKIKWNLDEAKMDFVMTNPEAAAIFESANYFREFRYEKVQGILEYNPISHMYQYAVKTKQREFDLETYAAYWGSKKEFLIEQMIYLADRGYIYFNTETQRIYVKDKIYNYENAHYGRADYDVLRLESIIKAKPNAVYSLINNNLTIEGVREFIFSDSQEVFVRPTDQVVNLKKDRNMYFGGRITAGRVDFYAKNYDFDYKAFKIGPNKIDSMRMYYPDKTGQLKPVHSVIEDINGYLNIDYANNKSGRRKSPEYPIFTSTTTSAVYYDRPDILGGVYKRNKFYFKIDPFVIDSLDNFTIEGFTFPGTFHSADILPDIKTELSIRPDYSLGFNGVTPPEGYPLYKGKGKASMEIDLSNQGLLGSGDVYYLGSTSKSKKFTFFPDSMNAQCHSFDLPKGPLYPKVIGVNIYNHWMPYKDSMYIHSQEQPLKVFEMGYNMTGYVVLTPGGLKGNGTVSWPEADYSSRKMNFGPNKMFADESSISIKSLDFTKVVLHSSNVKSVVDFDKKIGDFKSNLPINRVRLPLNQYQTTLNDFKWDMTAKNIQLKTPEPLNSPKAYFISEHVKQDSLKFAANTALFDMKTNLLTIEKIPYIGVADARVFPDSGRAVVEEFAVMRTLYKSKVQADTGKKYHNIYNCTMNIYGRNNMLGNGYYDYVDKQKKKQKIYFGEIKVDLSGRAAAEGMVFDTSKFTITPKIAFKGSVKMKSLEKYLLFDGFLLPVFDFEPPYSRWFRYESRVNPDSVIVSLGTPKDDALRELFTGFAISIDSFEVYPLLFSRKYNPRDLQIHSDSGIFFYDLATTEFRMGDPNKLIKKAPAGNIFVLNTTERKSYAEGKVNLNLNFPSMSVNTAGSISRKDADSVTFLDLMMTMDFVLTDEISNKLVKIMRDGTEGGAGLKATAPGFKNALAELIEPSNWKEVNEELNKYGTVKLTPEIRKTIFLTGLKLAWVPKDRSMVYHGPAGLVNIGSNKIDKQIEVFMAIDKKSSGDKIEVSMKAGNDFWIYFSYQRGILSILTSDDETNKFLVEKTEKILKDDYQIRLATTKQKANFEASVQ